MLRIPEVGSRWKHRNGCVYIVSSISNLSTKNTAKYPITIHYKNCSTGSEWSRPYTDWYRSMTYSGITETAARVIPHNEPNFFTIVYYGNWVARVQFNGEYGERTQRYLADGIAKVFANIQVGV